MKRRLFHTALVALLLLLPTAAMGYDIEFEGIYYDIIASNELRVTTNNGQLGCYSGDVVIPPRVHNDDYHTYHVTAIDACAFKGCPELTSVNIGYNVNTIGQKAFQDCPQLRQIKISDAVTAIKDSTFAGCTSLTTITLPNSLKSIGANVFNGCTLLETISIGDGSAKITVNQRALNGCPALKSICCYPIMPPVMIGDCFTQEMLNNVTLYVQSLSLTDYKLDPFWGRFTHIDAWCYDFCVNGIYYTVISPTEVAVSCHAPTGGSYTANAITIPDKVVYAGEQFTVTAIGKGAFKNCGQVGSVTMPETITAIGEEAFMGCSGLKGITFPLRVSVIDKKAFMGCSKLTSLTIPSTIYAIEDSAFYGCSGLKSLDLGTSVSFISNYAFASCYNLPNVYIPHSVEAICVGAFQDCTALKDVTLDADFMNLSIDGEVFKDCYNLASITSLPLAPPDLDNQHGGLDSATFAHVTLQVPHSRVDTYRNADVWGQFSNIMPLPYDFQNNGIYYCIRGDNEASVASNGNANCYNGDVTVPNAVYLYGNKMTVTGVSSKAFANNSGIKKVVLPNSITEIGNDAFWQSSLTQITLPKNITKIDRHTFYGCQSLSSITIPDKVTAICDSAFAYCTGLRNVVLPEGIKTIGQMAFLYAGAFSEHLSINLPNTLTDIGNYAFCATGIRHLVIPNSIDTIPEGAFSMCAWLESLEIPNSIKVIGYCAFTHPGLFLSNKPNQIKDIVIPNSVKKIGAYAFVFNEFERVTIGSGVERIGDNAFATFSRDYWPDLPISNEMLDSLLDASSHEIAYVNCLATTPPIMTTNNAFDGSYNHAALIVPQGSVNKYKNAEGWKSFVYIYAVTNNDVNDDGEVNIADVNCIIDAIIKGETNNPILDANNDGEVNIADINAILDEILQGNQ